MDNKSLFRISHYATTSTRDSVYIIGGLTNDYSVSSSVIAEYKDGIWKNSGNLAEARKSHAAITSGSITLVIGGKHDSGSS